MAQLLLTYCTVPNCRRLMTELRVYLATKNMEMVHMRGAICQVCTGCFKPVFHTNPIDQSDFSVAQALIDSFYEESKLPRGPPLPKRSPQSRTPPSGRPVTNAFHSAPPPSQPSFAPVQGHPQPPSSQIQLSFGTQTAEKPTTFCSRCSDRGQRGRGNENCMEGLCQSCCLTLALEARDSGTARRLCPVARHKPNPPSSLPPHGTINVSTYPTPSATPFPSATYNPGVSIQQPLYTQSSQQPMPPQTAPSSAPPVRQKALARALDPAWLEEHQRARSGVAVEKTRKMKEQEFADIERRTIRMILYHKANTEALDTLWLINDTFPKCQLKDNISLMRELKLDSTSIIDVYQGASVGWMGCSPESVLTVSSGRPLILRIRPSLTNPLPLSECPHLDTHVAHYDRQDKGNLKRQGQDMTTPLAKVPRLQDNAEDLSPGHSVATAARTPTPNPVLRQPAPHPMLCPETHAWKSASPAPGDTLGARRNTGSKVRIDGIAVRPVKPLVCSGKNGEPIFPRDFAFADVRYALETELKYLQLDNLPEKTAFSTVFSGAAYVKSTVGSHRKCIREAPPDLVAKFEALGHTPQGSYSLFIKELNALQAKARKSKRKADIIVSDSSDNEEDPHPRVPKNEDSSLPEWKKAAPNGLCPFCDLRLPESPSGKLQQMLLDLSKKSTPDPLPYNPHHRKLPILEHASFCQLHQHERVEVTKAVSEGWPLHIDFGALPARVQDFQEELEMVMDDPEQSIFFTTSRDSFKASSSGTMRSFETFGKQGAAYYGEKGFEILMNTLRSMFPQDKVSMEKFKPLSYIALIEEFLLPEVAVMLIMEDKDVSVKEAHNIHKASRSFGAMHHAIDVKNEPQEISLPSSSSKSETIDLTQDD